MLKVNITINLDAEAGGANPAHALDGWIAVHFHILRRWPAASDVIRWATLPL